jgi:hypothetical protein
MSRGRRICESIHIAVLGVWLGAILLAGAAAAVVFPLMKDLNPTLPRFAKYDGPHWLLAGGKVGQLVFFALDLVQFVCVLTAGATLVVSLVWMGLPVRRWSTFLRIALLLALVGVLAYQFGVLAPDLQANLRSYWAAAEAGDNVSAAAFREAFDRGHPLATRLLGSTAAAVLASIAVATWSIADTGPEPERAGSPLEEPRLLRTRA